VNGKPTLLYFCGCAFCFTAKGETNKSKPPIYKSKVFCYYIVMAYQPRERARRNRFTLNNPFITEDVKVLDPENLTYRGRTVALIRTKHKSGCLLYKGFHNNKLSIARTIQKSTGRGQRDVIRGILQSHTRDYLYARTQPLYLAERQPYKRGFRNLEKTKCRSFEIETLMSDNGNEYNAIVLRVADKNETIQIYISLPTYPLKNFTPTYKPPNPKPTKPFFAVFTMSTTLTTRPTAKNLTRANLTSTKKKLCLSPLTMTAVCRFRK
jgi:hypothetical protein